MDNIVLDDIRTYAIEALKVAYGYCGCASAPENAMLNSSSDDREFKITITDKLTKEA